MLTSTGFAAQWTNSTSSQLQTSLTNYGTITAGDTIWLRSGTYSPVITNANSMNALQWSVVLTGAVNNLITFRSYPNELAKIDRQWYLNNSGYLRFRDLEFYDSMKGQNPTNISFPSGPWVHWQSNGDGPGGNEWINCVIHDVNNAWEKDASGASIRGCVIWHVGLNQLEHVCYPAPRAFIGNIVAWESNDVIEHTPYGGYNGFLMQSNILFGGGQTVITESRDILLDDPTKSWNVSFNYLYNSYPNGPRYSIFYPQMFSNLQGVNCTINSNVVVSPSPFTFVDMAFTTVSLQGNTVHMNCKDGAFIYDKPGNAGTWTVDFNKYSAVSPYSVAFYVTNVSKSFAQWKTLFPSYDANSTANNSSVPSDQVYVIPNQDQSKRAHIAVYNFTHADTVTVTVSNVVSTGDTFNLYSAQNYNAGPLRTGTITNGTIVIPMTNLTIAPVLYGTNWGLTNPISFLPEFGAFVLQGSSPQPGVTTMNIGTATFY